jgi:four helix bundle protein
MKNSFEQLKVWQKSKFLVTSIYKITKTFPTEEKYGLTSHIRKAAVSIPSNIAEASTRQSKKEKGRFYEITFGSLIEVLNQLIIAQDLGYLNEHVLKEYRSSISEISRILDALHKSTKR